jgi:hypothetical protein
MLKKLALVLFSGFITLLLPAGQALELRAQDKPSRPLFPTVFLKPGETQHLVFFAPESKIGARDRTGYDFTPVNEAGDKSAALKGVAVKADTQRMGEFWDNHGARFVAIKLSAAADVEPGIFLIRMRAMPFGGPPIYEATVRLIIAK